MSTNLLYHAFGLKTHTYFATEYRDGAIFFHVRKKEGVRCCVNCKSCDVVLAGRVERWWNCVPIGLKPTIIVAHLPRSLSESAQFYFSHTTYSVFLRS